MFVLLLLFNIFSTLHTPPCRHWPPADIENKKGEYNPDDKEGVKLQKASIECGLFDLTQPM